MYEFPEGDIECRKVVFSQAKDSDKACKYVKDFSLCVQAGGNVGVWANYLANRFETVLSFEFDEQNFRCLEKNAEDGVEIYNFGLGEVFDEVGVKRFKDNCGANHVIDGTGAQIRPLDSLKLESCGLIILDVEGYEEFALRGAMGTITKFKPVIMYEDKGLSLQFTNHDKGWIEKWMEELDYHVVQRVHRDVILEYRPGQRGE